MRPVVRRVARGTAGLALVAVAFEVVSRAGLVDARSLPPASVVLGATASLLVDPQFLGNVVGTLAAWLVGIVLATCLAVPAGLLLGSSARGYAATAAAVEFLRPIPSVALIPLAILLLGRGVDMRVALVAYASVWPVLFNTIYGMRAVDPVARETARSFGFGRLSVIRLVSLPSAAPFIATGIRISAAIALIVAISAELIAGGGPGIGTWMLARSQAGVARELLYAAIVVAGVLGLAIDALMLATERRLFAWHRPMREAP